MKQEKTLRQRLIFFLVIALVLPMLCFATISQIQIWRVSNDYLDEIIANDIHAMDTALDMVLDKYAAALYDFCTDEDVIRLVETIESNEDELEISSSQLRRKLIHICNRNEGIEGITLITPSGRILFYDRMIASSVTSTWAGLVKVPMIEKGEVYQASNDVIRTGEGDIYLYQIGRKLVDFRDIHGKIGTVILTINVDTLKSVISDGENVDAFICADGNILTSTNDEMQMKNISQVKVGNRKTKELVNKKSGWTLYEYYSVDAYLAALAGQTIFWIVAAVVMSLLLGGTVWYVTSPILNKVDGLIQAMNQVEGGDFQVQVDSDGRIPREVRRIVEVFNGMVRQLKKQMEQIKQSAIDQKNAEISAMEAQIDPHFLYNTLDTINWKALENNEYEISSMVGALADILRYSIRNPGDTVSIGQALYWIEQYSMLQSKKLEAPFELEIDALEDVKNHRIHKLLIQPFVENAIRHGFCQKKELCKLQIRVQTVEDQLHIMIKDNGKGLAPEQLSHLNNELIDLSGHVGLTNVRRRLELYYGDEATVYFESKEGYYTIVHLFVNII